MKARSDELVAYARDEGVPITFEDWLIVELTVDRIEEWGDHTGTPRLMRQAALPLGGSLALGEWGILYLHDQGVEAWPMGSVGVWVLGAHVRAVVMLGWKEFPVSFIAADWDQLKPWLRTYCALKGIPIPIDLT